MSALHRALSLIATLAVTLGLSVTIAAPNAAASNAWGGYANGKIPTSALCAIPWQPSDHLRCDAAKKFIALNKAYKAKFGANVCVNDAYRSYAKQVATFKKYGSPRAAKPGTSNHGWGVALDLGCGVGTFGHARYKWFTSVAPKYGIAQPSWAKKGGSNPEAWHWQYWGTASKVPTPVTPEPAPKPKPPTTTSATKVLTTAAATVTGEWPRTATVTVRNKKTGAAMAGLAVKVTRRALDETAGTTVGTYKTDSKGRVAYTYAPGEPTAVTFTFAGTSKALPTSAAATLTTPTKMFGAMTGRRWSMVVGRLVTPAGEGVRSQTVYLQKRDAESQTWTTVATLRTDDRGFVSAEARRQQDKYYRFVYPGVTGQYVASTSSDINAGWDDRD